MLRLLILAMLSAIAVSSSADEVAKTSEGTTNITQAIATPPVELEHCTVPAKNHESLAKAAATQADLSKTEVLARLIYAESLSTGYWKDRCQAASADAIMTGIGWGVLNRVKGNLGKKDPYYATIFQKSQFATSFTTSTKRPSNPFAKAFLCPLSAKDYLSTKTSAAEIYAQAQSTAQKLVEQFEKTSVPAPYNKVTNFFYPRSEYFGEMRPKWAPNENPEKNKGYLNLLKTTSPCVEFYNLKN